MQKFLHKIKSYLKKAEGVNPDAAIDEEEKTSRTFKLILIAAVIGVSLLAVVGSLLTSPVSVSQDKKPQKSSLKDWLPAQQARTESAVLEKALKSIQLQRETLAHLEKQQREERLAAEVRWQQMEETLAELHQKNAEKPLTVNSGEENGVSESVPSLRHDTLHLSPPEPPALKKTAANYVPAGSFVKAVLLSGLDVSAGVTSSQEPRPVLLRLMDKGSLPNHLHSHLEDCRLIGAAVGDISSERAYIRLERLSCVHREAFSDFPVFGYVAGNDGKAGIRGRVVMKDAAIVSRAFFSGFLGGLSEGGANSVTDSSVSALGQVNSVSAGNVLKYSGYEGASNAMDLYADYLIKRAELYQPVIEVSAGTPVDVVFHKGFYLEGLSEKDAAPMKASKTIPTFYTQQSEINEEE